MATTARSSTTLRRDRTGRSGGLGDVDMTVPILSFAISAIVLGWFLYAYPDTRHWFAVPVFAGGVLIGVDAVHWLRGELDLFDPVGVIGLLGFHFFFLAPLLTVGLHYWGRLPAPVPSDWRPWLGYVGILNLIALVLYRVARGAVLARKRHDPKTAGFWQLDSERFAPILILALLITALFQFAVYASYGGIGGYIAAYGDRYAERSMSGMGAIFMISESFPVLLFMGYAVATAKRPGLRTWAVVGTALIVFFILKMLFGGLRGSRSNTIWGIFWAAGIVHFWIRPLNKKIILIGLIPLFVFMFAYGFYKSYGADTLDKVREADSVAALQEDSGRSWEGVLLGDLARSNVQAFLVYRLIEPSASVGYQLQNGRTYVDAALVLVPNSIPIPSTSKTQAGTDLFFGPGAYASGARSSRVYGLLGEAMLNFGVYASTFGFVILGIMVGVVKRWFGDWRSGDARWLIAPFLVNLCFAFLASDLDNTVFFTVKNGLVPIGVIMLSSNRLRAEAKEARCVLPRSGTANGRMRAAL